VEVGWSLLLERDFVYFNLFGTRGAAVLNPLTINREIQGRLVNITPPVTIRAQVRSAYQQLIKNWVELLLRDEPPETAVADALLINRIADAFYQSSAIGAEVRLTPVDNAAGVGTTEH
jgi:predicted dehydrogenase